MHTPGHTPGSVCFYLESRSVIFLGDMVVNSGQYVGASMPFPKTNMRLYERSLRRMAEMDFDIACLAHGQVFQGDADQRIRRMLDWYLKAPVASAGACYSQRISSGEAERVQGVLSAAGQGTALHPQVYAMALPC
jgi:glyoxylase-like metal-dependent hydrolase (beta-lactamase superfamily II)